MTCNITIINVAALNKLCHYNYVYLSSTYQRIFVIITETNRKMIITMRKDAITPTMVAKLMETAK